MIDYSDVHIPSLRNRIHMENDEEIYEDDENLEKGSDSDFVLARIEEEKNGLAEYADAIESIQDPQLKEILEAIQEDEQKHQAALQAWLDMQGEEPPEESEELPEEPGEMEEVEASLDDELPIEDSKTDLIDDIKAVLAEHEEEDDDLEKEDDEFLEEDETEKRCSKSITVPILKSKNDQQIVYGVVSEPDTIDLQGDRLSESEIRKACHRFMMTSQRIGKEHNGPAKADIIESYIAPVDFSCNGQTVRKGSWIMAVKIHDPELWAAVKKGDITGFSIAGTGTRTPIN